MAATPKNVSTFNGDDGEAERRFEKHGPTDPFPEIPSALLNSADIHDYIEKTGMVCPYHPEKKLKSSSLELDIGDLVIFWDDEGKHCEQHLKDGDTFSLRPNSLVFIKTAQKFRMPPYMAIRFNLKITNVHRGLLLGTGPLVDPGFQGHLLIPVHNLTTNTYIFKKDEGFIWVEFTKISPNKEWYSGITHSAGQIGKYVPFPKSKYNADVKKYLGKAAPHLTIQNAIPDFLRKVRYEAGKAAREAEAAKKWNVRLTLGGLVALATIVFLVLQSYTAFDGVISQSNDLLLSVQNEYKLVSQSDEITNSVSDLHSAINTLSKELENTKQANTGAITLAEQNERITALENRINEQVLKINQLTNENHALKRHAQISSSR